MNEFVERVIEWLNTVILAVGDYVVALFKNAFKVKMELCLGTTFLVALLLTLLLFSAFWSVSIAQSRGRLGWPHFFLGLLFPYLYPILILFTMDLKRTQQKLADEEQKKEQQSQREQKQMIDFNMKRADSVTPPPQPHEETKLHLKKTPADSPAEQPPSTLAWNREFFQKIHSNPNAINDSWEITLDNGHFFITAIEEVQDNLIVAQVKNESGQNARMRFPYARIQNFAKH